MDELNRLMASAPGDLTPTPPDPHGLIGAWLPRDVEAADARRAYRNAVAQLLRDRV